MFIYSRVTRPLFAMFVSAFCTLPIAQAQTPPSISDVPLFLNEGVAPLNMLVLGRDHKLYYEAYNDASDLDGDGTLDIRYKPATIDYYGYFDSFKCYDVRLRQRRFNPSTETDDKTCAGADEWSGDFLNYLTTSRIDALRKVLYGGYRSTDTGDRRCSSAATSRRTRTAGARNTPASPSTATTSGTTRRSRCRLPARATCSPTRHR